MLRAITQEIQDVLNLRWRQRFEVADYTIGLRAAVSLRRPILVLGLAVVAWNCVFDRLQQIRGAPVVQKKQPLADSPQRSGAEFIRACRDLINAIRQALSPYGARRNPSTAGRSLR
jgi:hypothetical protein